MISGYRTTLFLFASSILIGSLSVAHASRNDGSLLKSFRAWLGRPAVETTIRVKHITSGVVLTLTGGDTTTVNRLHGALPERRQKNGSGSSVDGKEKSSRNCRDREDHEKGDEDTVEDEADHEQS